MTNNIRNILVGEFVERAREIGLNPHNILWLEPETVLAETEKAQLRQSLCSVWPKTRLHFDRTTEQKFDWICLNMRVSNSPQTIAASSRIFVEAIECCAASISEHGLFFLGLFQPESDKIHPAFDMHKIGDWLLQQGFVEPVVDIDRLYSGSESFALLLATAWGMQMNKALAELPAATETRVSLATLRQRLRG